MLNGDTVTRNTLYGYIYTCMLRSKRYDTIMFLYDIGYNYVIFIRNTKQFCNKDGGAQNDPKTDSRKWNNNNTNAYLWFVVPGWGVRIIFPGGKELEHLHWFLFHDGRGIASFPFNHISIATYILTLSKKWRGQFICIFSKTCYKINTAVRNFYLVQFSYMNF